MLLPTCTDDEKDDEDVEPEEEERQVRCLQQILPFHHLLIRSESKKPYVLVKKIFIQDDEKVTEGSPSHSGSEVEQSYSGSEATGDEEQNSSGSEEEQEREESGDYEASSEDKSASESEHDSPTSKESCCNLCNSNCLENILYRSSQIEIRFS